jgi:tetratricopeptide (TPR) repeat protein
MIGPVMGMSQILSVELQQLTDDSELRLSVDGVVTSPIRYVGGRGEQQFRLPASSFEFAPDRSRRQWRDIPIALGPQTAGRVTYKVKLPGKGEGFTLSGARQIDESVAGRRFLREVDLDGGLLTIEERVSLAGGELAAADIAEERRRAATLTRNNLVLRSPEKATRRWVYAGRADRSALAPVERAYQAQIDREPDEVEHYLNRARFREGTFDFAGALEDYTAAIELENSPDLLAARARIHANMLQDRQALGDLQEAYDFDPSPSRAIALAGALADNGDIAAARELLEQQDGDRSVRQGIELALADLDARSGAGEEGLERIDRLLRERPNDADLLNAKCWHVAAWQVALNEAEELCTKAVENAGYVPPVLDSRAMLYLRAGDYRKALADAEAALQLAPEQAQTLLLRGLIRRALGEEQASGDIREALARTPASRDVYRRYGFDLN